MSFDTHQEVSPWALTLPMFLYVLSLCGIGRDKHIHILTFSFHVRTQAHTGVSSEELDLTCRSSFPNTSIQIQMAQYSQPLIKLYQPRHVHLHRNNSSIGHVKVVEHFQRHQLNFHDMPSPNLRQWSSVLPN